MENKQVKGKIIIEFDTTFDSVESAREGKAADYIDDLHGAFDFVLEDMDLSTADVFDFFYELKNNVEKVKIEYEEQNVPSGRMELYAVVDSKNKVISDKLSIDACKTYIDENNIPEGKIIKYEVVHNFKTEVKYE